MKNYTLGFVFDKKMQQVLLLHRIKPPYEMLLNGVGGKIQANENPQDAMIRELKEETNIALQENDKIIFLTQMMFFNGISLYVFYIVLDSDDIDYAKLEDTEEGVLAWYDIKENNLLDITNPWLAGDGNVPYFIYLSIKNEQDKLNYIE